MQSLLARLRSAVAGLSVVAAVLLGSLPLGAGEVTPSDRVSNALNVREAPSTASPVLLELHPGERLPHLGSVPYWHRVQLPDGRVGFVSSAWSLVLHGEGTDAADLGDEGSPGGTAGDSEAAADSHSSQGDFDFWISESLIKRIAQENTLMFPIRLRLTHRSRVHKLSSDCEIHIAAQPIDSSDKAGPPAFVVEPPNLCHFAEPSGGDWETMITNEMIDRDCTVWGFPRIYDEHLVGDETPTNPHHMLEIHPALKIECDNAGTLDATTFLAHFAGMSEIQPSSAAKCFDTKLWVRRNAGKQRYEFRAQRHKHCGNFASFEYSVFDEWIRRLGNGGHSALMRVRPEGMPLRTLKLYTYPGTAIDDIIESYLASAEVHQGGVVHGMLTFDYFSIVRTIRSRTGEWLPVTDWAEVKFPLALVAFGAKSDPDPEEHD